MSKPNSSKDPSNQAEGEVTLPFSVGNLLMIAPMLIIVLMVCGFYFSGLVQLMLGNRELKEAGHEAKAIDYFTWAISVNPNLAQAYSDRATTLKDLEQNKGQSADYSAARRDIAQAVKLAPGNYHYLETSLKIEHAAHNFRKEIAGYEKLITLESYMREYLLNDRAGLHYIVSDFGKERADRESIIKADAAQVADTSYDHRTNFQERAEQYRYLGEIDKAARDYEVCVKSKPESDDLMHLAYLYENSGRSSQALKVYSKVIEVDASGDGDAENRTMNSQQARYRRANLYLKFGENEKALVDADALLKGDVESPSRQAFRAKVLDIMGLKAAAEEQRKAALDHLTKNINDDPDCSTKGDAYAARADYYAASEQWTNAVKDYLIALSAQPSSLSVNYSDCARAYSKLGDYDNAIKFYAKAISTAADDDDLEKAYNGLAQVHLSQHKPAQAVEDCNKAIMQGGRNGASSDLRAKANRLLGKTELAKIDENEALGLEFSPLPDLL